eukprot:XP_019080564.1 PREDICTED: uncharacterized protein LOC104881683 isoform X2 [Vitis vinifera]
MGRKKRVKPSSSCSAPAAAVGVKAAFPSASSLSHGSPNKEAKKAAEMEAIKLDCDRAFDAFRRGNHHKALKLMKKFCSSYPNSGFVHTLQGTMYYQLALTIADSSTKLQYLKTAADSASRATLLSPEKMDSAHFFAHLLYLTSEKNDGYQEVVRECERALSIPVEKASLLVGRNQLEGSILMAQISELQEGLRSLIGMSNETMNNGVHLDLEAKFMLVPFSDLLKESKLLSLKYSEDGMELKDLEEREKEIEAKIQKTKLLENLRVLPEWQTEEASLQNYLKDGVPESSSRSSYKQEKIKRVSNLKKMKESARMMPYVVMYWDSISFDQKRRLLNVRIGDLIEYFGSNEYVEEALIFCEAMSFAKDNKSWKFLGCCFCSQRFKELIPYLKHLEVQHLRNVKVLAPEMMSMLPLELNSYWVDMLLKDRWKPVDTSAALKMIESGPKGELSCTVGGDRESHGGEVGGDQNIKEVDGEKGLPDAFPFDHNWPLSYDSERAGILSKIHIMFKLFFRHNYLSERLLKVLIKYSLEKLQTLVPELEPLIQGLDQTPLCLCFLQVPQLRYVYSYLEDLVRLCRLDFRSEKDGSVAETPRGGFDIKHRIGLSSESVSLLLDKHSNRGAVDFFTYHDNISADASSVAFTVDNLEDDALPGSDSLAAWIFGGPSNEQQLTSWARALQEKKHQAIDILSILEKEFPEYKSLCDSKCIHLRQEEAFQAVENILAEEFTKRRENLEFVPQGYEVLLKKRQEELARTSNDVFGSDAAEFTFISKVLKEVEALSLRVAGGTSHLSDQESDQEDESKTFEDLLEQDSLLEMAVQDQKEEVSLKLCEIDTSLMRCVGVMRNLQSKLGKISVIDYRSILWDHLEDLARKYATEKSDAVGRALLLEAALDTQKNINTADDNTKKTQKKSKKKKKNKSSRDAKDSKATGGIKQLLISDSPKSETAAGLKQQEEESRPHELELQAQETRLEEQYQGTELDEQVSPHSVNQNVELKQLGEESRRNELELQAQETQLEEQYRGAELDEQVSLHSDNQNEELKEQEEESRRNELELQAQETQLEEQYRGAELDEQVSLHSDNQNEELKEQEEESRRNELELQAQERKLGEQNRGVELDEQVSPHSDNQNVELKQQKEESRRLVLELRANVRKLLEILEDQRQIESGGRQKQLTGQSRNAKLDEQVSPFSDYQNVELKQLKEESRRLELELRAQERKLEEQNRGLELDEQVSPHPDNQNVELKQQEEELELRAQERELEEQIRGSELDEQVSPHSDNENVELKQQKEESRRLEQSGSAELDEQVHPRKFTRRTDMLPDSNSSISSSNKEKPHPDLSVGEYEEPKVLSGLPGGRTSEDSVLSPDQRGSQCTFDDMNASDVHGTSLKKSLAQYDCFLDVIITSLWHLRWFRFELQRRREIPHAHAGNPCVFCSLCNTFTVLSLSPVCWKKDVVAPCLAKMALSDLYPDNIFFQEAQTNDVISILVGIFECLHQSFSAPGEKYSGENWDCTSDECLAHTIIGMNLLERISCCYCGLESGNEQFTSFLRMVDESKLRRMKDTYMDSSFDKLLKLVNASSLFPCDPEAGGCGKLNPTQHFLSSPPHVFITVIDRKNGHERGADISTTLAALSTKIDLGILYEGLDEGNTHYLISLVCFTGKNYRCFAYRHEVEKWIMLDDEECKVIGCWNDVITVCRTRNLQPLILFFEDEMQIF